MALKPRSQAGVPPTMTPEIAPGPPSQARTEPGFRPPEIPAHDVRPLDPPVATGIREVEVTLVEVTWGDEFFQPVPFNGFHVGPFKASRALQDGQTVAEVGSSIYRQLDQLARGIYEEKARDYLERLGALAGKVDAARVR